MPELRVLIYACDADAGPVASLCAELVERMSARITLAGPGGPPGSEVAHVIRCAGVEPIGMVALPAEEVGRRLTEIVLEEQHDLVAARWTHEEIVRELLRCCPCPVWVIR